MKKIICLFLACLLFFGLTACGGKNTSSDDGAAVDLEYYAQLGKIPECPYKLGDDVDAVNAELSERAASYHGGENGDTVIYNVTEGEQSVCIDNGLFLYYYEIAKKEKGLSFIVDFATAYGFDIGTISTEVKKAFSAYPYTERDAYAEELFFLYGSSGTVLEYQFGSRSVWFVFEDNSLCATVITDRENWRL